MLGTQLFSWILPLPSVGRTIDELQGGAVRIAEIGARTVDHAPATILLEEYFDAIWAQLVESNLIRVRGDHECMMDPIGALKLPYHGRRPFDQEHADPASVQKGHAFVRQSMEEFAADDLG